ncbi:acetylornithine deacetylase [Sansalvadorimonas sp. 2012CJ34-2]|uniref:Acetylornithine deacetylase n=1 Tax=Parendozoicomonas callyspongiae TaxID=2942213 RepID=A0ABT0PDV9_9GAMM|nr:acetylornithine deacetylase [Sansalvadorimonas sp. 2012CJ34-2]MCL6269231.1 acetylornithine deacetylase [Sansalvadorimonas sp. 2012CJ34-2]
MSQQLIPAIRQLIATPSVSSTRPDYDQGNLAVIELLANWLGDMEFSCEILPIPNAPGKANLIATLGKGPGGLVLSGHTDTVPCDDSLWSQNPFTLTEQDNKLYGLGTCDMKSFLALAMEAARGLKPEQLKQPLIILATADEESSMSGARELVRIGQPKARTAIIGEPTGLIPLHMHKGIMMERLTITGKSGHSSDPSKGRNAMDAMHHIMTELMVIREEWKYQYSNPGFTVPMPTMNFGCIHGGDNPNRICETCSLEYDVRMLPGMDPDEIRRNIYQRTHVLSEQAGVVLELEPVSMPIPPFSSEENSSLLRTCEGLTGYRATSAAFATEAPFLRQMGMDTVVMGPGNIAQAHQPDEYLALDTIEPTVTLLKNLIHRYCLQSE